MRNPKYYTSSLSPFFLDIIHILIKKCMFSYSDFPLETSSKIQETIDFARLIKIIRNHPKRDVIEIVIKLRSEGNDDECRSIKISKLPWITPNCVVKKRSLKNEFEQNFIQSSGFIYFDIDEGNKEEFISKYGDCVSLVAKSVSGRGISILIRISRLINSNEEFILIYDYIKNTYFKGLKFDDNVRFIGNAWIISWDKEPFINYDYECLIPESLKVEKGSYDVLSTHPSHIHRMNPSPKEEVIEINAVDLDKFFPRLLFETTVEFEGKFLIEPTRVLTIRFPKIISDGTKHQVYRKLIHDIIYLNPNGTPDQVISFIKYINKTYAKPQMENTHLEKLVTSQYIYIKNNSNYVNTSNKSLRVIHYQKRRLMPSKIRLKLSNKMRGILDRSLTWKRIQNAIKFLLDEHETYTYQDISILLGISISTVKRHIKTEKSEYEKEFSEILNEINSVSNQYL
jgi:hypothetical protein